jgi:cell wall assembly regulator SMI1
MGAIGATETKIAAAAEDRLSFPEELLYRVTRARRDDGHEAAEQAFAAVGCYPLPLDEFFIATTAARPLPWIYAAQEAACTSPSGAVQALVGSPGWLVFGGNGAGDRVAIDLTPRPRGNIGQVIMIWHDENYGAGLFARSLTDMVLGKRKLRDGSRRDEMPAVAG